MADRRVMLEDCKALKYCHKGVRGFCERAGLEFDQLRKEGIPISKLEYLDDVYVRRLIRQAELRHGR